MSLENPVRSLNPEVARKIAAGEVIDRPNAIIRELMDNAIDSGAKNITVEISGGGIEKIRIVDDGCGMTKEDLQASARPHATSKIATETDLMKLSTLGFRGEALASIAAVSRLSITSGGWKMRASITEDHILEPVAETKGTIVQSEGLFENFPARRQFLKRAATEGVMCKNTFIEKALARPDISFRFISDGETKIDLHAGQSFCERFVYANSYTEPKDLFFELTCESQYTTENQKNWSARIIIGEPAVSRSNKKDIFIYANGRRIQEYSLMQAVEYGGQGFFPNGTYPVAVVFVDVNPALIDFNIHPAKKEARFHDISELHHGISSTVKNFFKSYTLSNFQNDQNADDFTDDLFETKPADEKPIYEKHISYTRPQTGEKSFSDFRSKYLGGTGSVTGNTSVSSSFSSSHKTSFDSALYTSKPSYTTTEERYQSISDLAKESLEDEDLDFPPIAETEKKPVVRFIGSCLGTFLLVEKNNCLYLIDQHAVHERILFNKIMNSQGNSQPLLIPYKIHTESKTQDNQLEKLKDSLTQIGFETEKVEDGYWEIKSIPERWTGTQYELQTLLFVKQVEPQEIIRSIAAMTACKAAVKDGYVLDDITAGKLAEEAFTLDDPHCPHGRPIYTVISREKLFELVKRT